MSNICASRDIKNL